jgi:histidine ammonia-lyase
MGMIAARHARDIVTNAELVVAMETMAAAQALDLRSPLEPAEGTRAARDAVRDVVPFLEVDRELRPDIEACVKLVRDGGLATAVESVVGPLD